MNLDYLNMFLFITKLSNHGQMSRNLADKFVFSEDKNLKLKKISTQASKQVVLSTDRIVYDNAER